MRHVCQLLLALSIIHLAACNRKTGIFNKFFESQQSVQEPTDSTVRPAGGRRNDRNLVPPLGSANGDLSVLKETLFDPLADWEWDLAERAFAGDVFAVLREGMLTNKAHVDELKATWSDPVVLRFLRDETPLLKAFKPLRPLFSKEALTPQDGVDAVETFKNAMLKVLATIEAVRDPEGMATLMFNYSNLQDPEWVSLIARLQAGEKEAQLELQQYILDRELGGLIDLKEMGFDGQEPSILKQAREAVQREEPELWDSIFREDPIARKYMEAPETVLKDVMDLTSEFATNLKGKTTLDFGTASV
ncbi:hypothetical protein NSK_005456 [Nannochloropsis salina CCMP1776]|uniref:Uncharacterized protein n=1 Tax=Nannochloropsis salina CCMP1776 TaxID=1027361 RepID=A0A4D9CVM0_9STRA|nr:hypothetical protein NSK_005456 [Nannochloropsis salina CCMP1776]|eukprot:TFJ83240.1 hypothetical protein NSK_005456 [Nannochloropsis salina CCMP1776]